MEQKSVQVKIQETKHGEEHNGEVGLQIENASKYEDPIKEEQEKTKPLLADEDAVTIEMKTEKEIKNSSSNALAKKAKKQSLKLTSPITQLKEAKEDSSNSCEFVFKTLCIITRTLGWLTCVGGMPFMSVIMLIMGSIFLHSCPAQPKIPVYLIVVGVIGTMQHFMSLWTKYTTKSEQSPIKRKVYDVLEGLMQLSLTIWFILGCVWVYGIYEPEYEDTEKTDVYCHKGLYLFAFWLLNISFIILGLIVVASLIFIICCVTAIIKCAKCASDLGTDDDSEKEEKEGEGSEKGE